MEVCFIRVTVSSIKVGLRYFLHTLYTTNPCIMLLNVFHPICIRFHYLFLFSIDPFLCTLNAGDNSQLHGFAVGTFVLKPRLGNFTSIGVFPLFDAGGPITMQEDKSPVFPVHIFAVCTVLDVCHEPFSLSIHLRFTRCDVSVLYIHTLQHTLSIFEIEMFVEKSCA